MTERYISIKDVMKWLRLGRTSIYRRIEDGTLPRPIKIGSLSRFKESEVKAALKFLETERNN